MTETREMYRRTFWGLLTAGLAFAFVTLMGQQTVSSDDLTDAVKRQKVESLYNGYHNKFPEVLDVTPQQAMNLIADQKSVFIDIREPDEQQVSMLPGAITEKEFLNNFKSYEDHVKIAYCTISYRSGKFAQKLQKEGIPVYNLRGGILAWVHDGGKVYNQNGETHRVHVYDSEWNLLPARYEAVW
ncbi:MAG: rhodanese-like domain-containing protein [Desulfobacterales bacterium]|nr:MAG: rhodanese-like domain-containing protein [Desulfobacterales bacterium]